MSPTGLSIFLGVDRKLVVYTCRYQGQDFLNLVAAVPDHGMNESSEESWYAPGKVEDLQAAFEGFAPKLVRMLSYVKECGLWQLRDQDPLSRWVKGRVIIIGDAAHPMTPHLGQGGSQAIEDADMLAYCLAGLDSSTDASAINAALERTFSLRYERATMCQERSREQAFGKRAVQLETTTSMPSLDPMQFAGYTFSYQGAKWWAERQEAIKSNGSSSGSKQENGSSKPIALDIVPEVATLSAASAA
jgi:salicylate hydroxylase